MKEQFLANEEKNFYALNRGNFVVRDHDVNETELKSRESGKQKDARYLANLANQDAKVEERQNNLKKLLDEGYHPEVRLDNDLKQFLMTGSFAPGMVERKQQPPRLPYQGFEGQTMRVRPHVIEDQSGATLVETPQLLQFLSFETAKKALEELGLGNVELPQNWDNLAIIERAEWLRAKQEIFSFQQFPDNSQKDELRLVEMKGGAGIFDWDDVLEEEYEAVEVDPTTLRQVKVTKTRPVGIRNAVSRLLEIQEFRDRTDDPARLKEIDDEHLNKLSAYFKNNFLDRANAAIDGNIKDYIVVHDFAQAFKDLSKRYGYSGKADLFNKVFPPETVKKIMDGKESLDKKYREEYRNNPHKYEELFRKLEEEAAQVIQIQRYGLYGRGDQQREDFEKAANIEIRSATNDLDREMLRWRKSVLQEGFDLNYNEIRIKQPTADWRDSGKNLDLILRFLERTDFSEQQLSQALQAAAQIVQDIPVNSDTLSKEEKAEAVELQKKLTEKLQAILAVDSFYSVMEHADMNPEKVMGAFGSFKDETFEIFFERFNHDSNGKRFEDKSGNQIFMKDSQGEDIKDEQGKKKEINLLNLGMSVYMKRSNKERKIMNYIEKWTRNIDVMPGRAEEGIEAECVLAVEQIYEAAGKSRDTGKITEAVRAWYRNNTILGAHDEHTKDNRKEEMIGDLKVYDDMSADERKERDDELSTRLWKKGLIEELRETYNIKDEQLKEMIDNGTIEQVMNNAHRLWWMMAQSDYDGIRIWDPKAENPARPGTGQIVSFVYNGSTHLFHGRMVDHAWEFYVDEARGRVPKSNLIMQDELLGERGNLLPQNRTMVRFAEMLLGNDLNRYVDEKMGSFKNIDKLDLSNKHEKSFAKSAVIAEGLDKGELDFANADFAKMFESTNSWKYRWIDLYSDRKTMMDYMGANMLQQYLQQPNSEKFFQINSLEYFYSKREVRLQPWMKLMIPAHNRIGDHWKEWWKLDDRMTHAEKEAVIEVAAASNRLDAEYKHWMKHRYLGWFGVPGISPVRGFRQFSEAVDIYSREYGKAILPHKSIPTMAGVWGKTFVTQGFKYVLS